MWDSFFKLLVGALCLYTGWVYAWRPVELYEHQQVRWFSVLRRVLPKPGFLIYARLLGVLFFAVGCFALVVGGRELIGGVLNG
jgi:hypothetical protein